MLLVAVLPGCSNEYYPLAVQTLQTGSAWAFYGHRKFVHAHL